MSLVAKRGISRKRVINNIETPRFTIKKSLNSYLSNSYTITGLETAQNRTSFFRDISLKVKEIVETNIKLYHPAILTERCYSKLPLANSSL